MARAGEPGAHSAMAFETAVLGCPLPARPGDALLLVDHGTRWLSFSRPAAILEASSASDVPGVLAEVERQARRQAYHAVGVRCTARSH